MTSIIYFRFTNFARTIEKLCYKGSCGHKVLSISCFTPSFISDLNYTVIIVTIITAI